MIGAVQSYNKLDNLSIGDPVFHIMFVKNPACVGGTCLFLENITAFVNAVDAIFFTATNQSTAPLVLLKEAYRREFSKFFRPEDPIIPASQSLKKRKFSGDENNAPVPKSPRIHEYETLEGSPIHTSQQTAD